MFSAGLGGADAITVLPFTLALGLPDRFARRIARNTQLVLLEESNLAKVTDPAAGSGGLEDLTEKLCRAAWTPVPGDRAGRRRLGGARAGTDPEQGRGGARRARAGGRAAQGRAHRHQRLPRSGGSAGVACSTLRRYRRRRIRAALKFDPLPCIRLAEPFEQLRDASDRMLAQTGARPKIFLANLGKPADFTARATFAKNFFEAGGIEAVTQ